jgi:metal-responsive CopG/Arc/MetJ family transcriptional regulator
LTEEKDDLMMEKRRTIEIPETLYERVNARIKGTNVASVSDYVARVIRERLAVEKNEKPSGYSKEDEEKVKQRLKALGYL